MMNHSILVVDDEPLIRQSLQHDLLDQGYHVDVAASGEEATHLLERNSYSLVITDLIMDGIDGLELLKIIKARHSEQSVFILTGYGRLESAISALRLGAEDYLLKPYNYEEMVRRVAECLTRQELNRGQSGGEKMLSLCSECKQVRDHRDTGDDSWVSIEAYLSELTGRCLSHGICPDCYEKKLEELNLLIKHDNLKPKV